jgi:hypothetical protein
LPTSSIDAAAVAKPSRFLFPDLASPAVRLLISAIFLVGTDLWFADNDEPAAALVSLTLEEGQFLDGKDLRADDKRLALLQKTNHRPRQSDCSLHEPSDSSSLIRTVVVQDTGFYGRTRTLYKKVIGLRNLTLYGSF